MKKMILSILTISTIVLIINGITTFNIANNCIARDYEIGRLMLESSNNPLKHKEFNMALEELEKNTQNCGKAAVQISNDIINN